VKSSAPDVDGTHHPPLLMVPISRLSPAPEGQAREHFDAAALQVLAASVRRSGVRAPILVTPDAGGAGRYVLVAGERRWRAAQLAGLVEIPCIVDERLTDPKQRLLAQAEENLHREDLNAVEEAAVLVQLMAAFDVGAEEAGALIGRSYQHARRLIQLHEAPQPIREAIVQGHIDARAALELVRIYNRLAQRDELDAKQRALNAVDELVDRVVNERWSIRRLEKYARALEGGRVRRGRERPSPPAQPGGNDAPTERAAAANQTVPASGPPYRLDGAGLVLDIDRIARRDVSPEEREELIKVLEQLLTMVRRAVGTNVRRPVLHVENARNDAKP
jgi:ParB family transcriptional regulator, chromosome partitioning protein